MTQKIRWGLWNLQRGRDPEKVAADVLAVFDARRLDVFALNEFRDYRREVERLAARKGYAVLVAQIKDERGSGHNALLVRDPARVHRLYSFVAGATYYTQDGKRRAPDVSLAVVAYDTLWIVGHGPVGAWTAVRGGRAFIGAIRRRLAYRAHVRATLRVFNSHRYRTAVALEDWNASPPPNTKGRWSPEWLRRKVRGQFLRTHRNTGHGEIDFGIGRQSAQKGEAVLFTPTVRGYKNGSDHAAIFGAIETR